MLVVPSLSKAGLVGVTTREPITGPEWVATGTLVAGDNRLSLSAGLAVAMELLLVANDDCVLGVKVTDAAEDCG